MIGLAGFASSGLAGQGRLARIGLRMTGVGLGVFLIAEVAFRWWDKAGPALHPISEPLCGVGLILTGIAVLRAGRWTAWHRYTPLVAGLVPFVVDIPALALLGPDSRGFQFCLALLWASWLAMFLSTRAELRRPNSEQLANKRRVRGVSTRNVA